MDQLLILCIRVCTAYIIVFTKHKKTFTGKNNKSTIFVSYAFHLHTQTDNLTNLQCFFHRRRKIKSIYINPKWHIRIRDEILSSCKNGIPDAETIPNLKTVTMVIQETRRLYPPTPIVGREAFTDIRLGNLVVPKGVCIWILIPALHRHGEIWGEDANEFKPERFSEGISKACKYPQSYMPFGFGPRTCLGKNLAMMEAKVLVSLIVSKFSFTLSPTYQHSPNHKLLVEPQHGVVIRIVRQ
ncbi:unnamed protein product [Brassica rapa subsp. trilocularis]